MAVFDWLGSWVSTSFSGRRMSSSPPPSSATEWQRYGRTLWVTLASIAVVGALAAAGSRVLANGYSNWAVIVVAGDWHAHDGSPSEIFDNARRDVSAALVNIGFDPNNVLQFSVRPQRYPGTLNTDAAAIANSLWDLSNRTSGGCLLYFSSPGGPSRPGLGDTIFWPDKL